METKQIIENIESNLKFGMKVKLECINEESFLTDDNTSRYINQVVLDSSLCVEKVCLDDDEIILKDCDYSILFEELKYFKIVDPTFNDLIDITIKAVKDGLIEIKNLTDNNLEFILTKNPFRESRYTSSTNYMIIQGIDYIKRLYRLTINNEEDIKRIKEGDTGVLANGNEFKVIETDFNYINNFQNVVKVLFRDEDHGISLINNLSIFELKGSIINNY